MARLLVVDDDVGLLSFLCEFLERQGHQTRGVSNGVSGVQAVEEKNFDVAVIAALLKSSPSPPTRGGDVPANN